MNKMTKAEFLKAKQEALKNVVDSYVRLVYRYPDGVEQEIFGYVYDDDRGITLAGGWIDLEILVRIERRDTGVETVYNMEPMTSYKP